MLCVKTPAKLKFIYNCLTGLSSRERMYQVDPNISKNADLQYCSSIPMVEAQGSIFFEKMGRLCPLVTILATVASLG